MIELLYVPLTISGEIALLLTKYLCVEIQFRKVRFIFGFTSPPGRFLGVIEERYNERLLKMQGKKKTYIMVHKMSDSSI
jgi:hypothetical protein